MPHLLDSFRQSKKRVEDYQHQSSPDISHPPPYQPTGAAYELKQVPFCEISSYDAEKHLDRAPVGSYLTIPDSENRSTRILYCRTETGVCNFRIADHGDGSYRVHKKFSKRGFDSFQCASNFLLGTLTVKFNGKFNPQPFNPPPIPRRRFRGYSRLVDLPPPIPGVAGFYGTLKRDRAEELLNDQSIGTYIVRESDSILGHYALSYKTTFEVKHHIIEIYIADNKHLLDLEVGKAATIIIKSGLGVTPIPFNTLRSNFYEEGVHNSPNMARELPKKVMEPDTSSVSEKSDMDGIEWYYKGLSHVEGLSYLQTQSVGTYLLRDCNQSKGNYTLMWRDVEEVKKIEILFIEGKSYKVRNQPLQEQYFDSIQQTVNYFLAKRKDAVNVGFNPQPYTKVTESLYSDYQQETKFQACAFRSPSESKNDELDTSSQLSTTESTSGNNLTFSAQNPADFSNYDFLPRRSQNVEKIPELGCIPWYHHEMTKKDSSKTLKHECLGSYLLRDSVIYKGCLVLSYRDIDGVKHAILDVKDGKQFQFRKEKNIFENVIKAVNYYVSRKSLVCQSFHPTPVYYSTKQPKQSNDNDIELYADPNTELQNNTDSVDDQTYTRMDSYRRY